MSEPIEDARLPAHIEVTGLIRQVQAEGGFATVLQKGERDAGTLLLLLVKNGVPERVFERMPRADGRRAWNCVRDGAEHGPEEVAGYLARRGRQDPDLWILELDVPRGERFVR